MLKIHKRNHFSSTIIVKPNEKHFKTTKLKLNGVEIIVELVEWASLLAAKFSRAALALCCVRPNFCSSLGSFGMLLAGRFLEAHLHSHAWQFITFIPTRTGKRRIEGWRSYFSKRWRVNIILLAVKCQYSSLLIDTLGRSVFFSRAKAVANKHSTHICDSTLPLHNMDTRYYAGLLLLQRWQINTK